MFSERISDMIKWPIKPAQLTTNRLNCHGCSISVRDRYGENLGKCSNCGVMTATYIRGSLLALYEELMDAGLGYPIILVEKVSCPRVNDINDPVYRKAYENTDPTEKRFIKIEFEDNEQRYYADVMNGINSHETYCIYDLLWHYKILSYGENCKYLCTPRRDNQEQDERCVQSDLTAAADIIAYLNTHNNINLKKHKKHKTENFYSYKCDDSGLTELVYPIMISGVCVAVLIIGQIPNEKDREEIHSKCTKCRESFEECKIEFVDAVKIGQEISYHINEYNSRVNKRVTMRKTDFMYGYITKTTAEIEFKRKNRMEVHEIIQSVYKGIKKDFAIKTVWILTSSPGQERNTFQKITTEGDSSTVYRVNKDKYQSITEKIRSYDKWSSDPNESQKAVNILKDIDCFELFNKDKSNIYVVSSDTVKYLNFIFVYIEWDEDKDQMADVFFDTINAQLFALWMTEVTANRAHELLSFQKQFIHDMSQKVEIIRNHTENIKLKSFDWSEDTRAILDDYIKDINNMCSLIHDFKTDAEFQEAEKRMNIEEFLPYSEILFNIDEQYRLSVKDRKLYVPNPSNIVFTPELYPKMVADKAKITRCVNNLVSNAFKYSYQFTKIYLECYREGDDYIIIVTNYYNPVGDDIKNRMFELGISQSILRNYKKKTGSGYGLAIITELCALHGGKVEYLDEEGVLSHYNIPVLARVIDSVEKNNSSARKKERLFQMGISEKQYDELFNEYDRLTKTKADELNTLLRLNLFRNIIDEVVYKDCDEYREMPKKNYIRAALRSMTARIKFKITIPQKNQNGGSL